MKLTKKVMANAFATTATVYWVLDYLAFLLLPRAFPGLHQSLIDMMTLGGFSRAGADMFIFLVGGITFAISAWIFGFILGWSIEYFSSKEVVKESVKVAAS